MPVHLQPPAAPATNGNCMAMMTFRIDQGWFGDRSLDGPAVAPVIRSGRVMAGGRRALGHVIDERAVAGAERDRQPGAMTVVGA